MFDPESAFQKCLGRLPTAEERERLYRIRDAFGFREDDSMWIIIMALEHYRTLYELIPGMISDAAAEKVHEVQERIRAMQYEAEVNASKWASDTLLNLTSSVQQAAEAMTDRKLKTRRLVAYTALAVAIWVYTIIVFTVGVVIGDRVPEWVTRGLETGGVFSRGLAVAFNAPAGYVLLATGVGVAVSWGAFRIMKALDSGPGR